MRRNLVLLGLCGLLICGCSGTSGPTATTGEVILIAADRTGFIYTLDPATGQESLLLVTYTSTTVSDSVDVGVISAMIYLPDGDRLWAGTGGNAAHNGSIMLVDRSTGETTLVFDNSDETSGIPGLALRPTDGAIFSGEGDSGGLLAIDPATGDASYVGSFSAYVSGGGMTYSSDGTLYMAGDDTLYTIDTVTPASDAVAAFSFTGFPAFQAGGVSIGALTTRPSDGVIFGILKDGGGGGGSGPTYLVTVDPLTGVVTNVGVNSVKLDGLAFVPASIFP